MNLRHLEVFRHVMQTGSVKGAAAVLRVSDAAASKLLSTAERRMGLALFERAKGRLVPTPEARRLYADVEQLWERVERIEALTRSLAQPTGGILNLAISPSFGVTVVPQAATRLLASMPELTINVDLLIPHLLLQNLVDGIADLGVSFNPQQHPSVEVVDRVRCGLVCVMPASHVLAARKFIRAADLPGHPVVSFPQALDYGLSDEALFGRYSGSIARRLNVRSGQTACWFSLAGAGVAIVDAASVAGGAFPDLAIRPYRCDAVIEILLLRHRDRPLSRAASRFCDSFRRTWKELS
ncbi:LysR family transcriptional regulator [Ramlibacter sp. G-1-2-2]|uniref:LysR family transcriptional regulator n=1 Tax=Ramlibacter agri TaxID=2728837 RepID=A0A848H6E9_9BURK|nr:LysR substrate-binding domain-containing protein [Ramlibacter agri]NML46134.1 LysR family transcriptional regulator [Ramlibacter agri]